LQGADLTLARGLTVGQGLKITGFSKDALGDKASNELVPTALSVKQYVDAQVKTVRDELEAGLAAKAARGGSETQPFSAQSLTVAGNVEVRGAKVIRFFNGPSDAFTEIGSGAANSKVSNFWIRNSDANHYGLFFDGNNGRVGIGTTSPQRTLHIEGGEVHSGGEGAGYSFSNRGSAFVDVPGSGERWVWYSSNGVARLWSGSDKLFITAAGNVGIGTTAPAAKLDVNGNFKVKGWTIDEDANGNIIFARNGATVFQLKTDGSIMSGGRLVLRDQDPVVIRQGSVSGPVLNGTREGDSTRPSEFHQWTYWRKVTDGDSNLFVCRR